MSAAVRSLIVERYIGVWHSPHAVPRDYFDALDWIERLRSRSS